ncbi:hypothetical protein KM043_010680 [Ampulex compressa]|nr:hypothetical protein KM043_010680 [Ampulex compressa]
MVGFWIRGEGVWKRGLSGWWRMMLVMLWEIVVEEVGWCLEILGFWMREEDGWRRDLCGSRKILVIYLEIGVGKRESRGSRLFLAVEPEIVIWKFDSHLRSQSSKKIQRSRLQKSAVTRCSKKTE